MGIPKPAAIAFATAVVGIVLVAVSSHADEYVLLTMVGVVLVILGGLATVGLLFYYLFRPRAKEPARPPRPRNAAAGVLVRIAGACMLICGAGIVAGFVKLLFSKPEDNGPEFFVIWLGLPALLFCGGWQMLTGKV